MGAGSAHCGGGRDVMREFCVWLAATPLSQEIQDVSWIIPTVQTVHIVSIAIVMTSMAMLDLRLVGIAGRRQTLTDMAARFLPWVWIALVVLLCSGSILIIGEPARDLMNTVFWLKMSLLATGMLLTWTFQHMLRRNIG